MGVTSMTGYGRARGRLSDRFEASVVVRSVNYRFLDLQVRLNLREDAPEVEAAVREVVAGSVARGRVSIQVNLERLSAAPGRVLVDRAAVESVMAQLEGVTGGAGAPVEVRDVLALPGIVTVASGETVLDDGELDRLRAVVGEAAEGFATMRRDEGERLRVALGAELAAIRDFVDWFEPQMDELRRRLVERYAERIREVLPNGVEVDSDRIVQEAAIAADRADVAEEVVRLRSHFVQVTKRLDGGGAVGRQLDFMCQELLRELNTLGSKCREVGVADRLVDAKAAVERLREQVQNLE